jgi:hypothetical protein
MKKLFLISVFLLFSFTNIYAFNTENLTFNNISKLYVEYEDGTYQEIGINNISYNWQINQNMCSITGSKELLFSGELNKNSKISRVAVYMESLTSGSQGTFPINGYIAFDKTRSPNPYGIGYLYGQTNVPISTWLSGSATGQDISNLTSGVIDLNTNIITDGTTTVFTHNNSFDAANKSVNLRLQQYGAAFGGIPISE